MALIIHPFDIPTTQLTALLAKLIYPTDPRVKILTEAAVRYKQQVFTLSLEDVVAEKGMQAAEAAGFYLLAVNGSNQAVAAQLSGGSTPDLLTVSDLSQSRQVLEAIDAIRRVQDTEPAQDPNTVYELVTLQIPGLLLEAYWLKASGGVRGWLYPFHTFFTSPAPLAATPADQYLTASNILEAARQRLDFPDRGAARKGRDTQPSA
jgi:hypothetical protein